MTIVSTMPAAKKVFTALVIATPLTLVACGSGEAASDSNSAAGSASTVTSSTTAPATPKAEESDPQGDEGKDEGKTGDKAEAEVKAEGRGAESVAAEKPVEDAVALAGPDAQAADTGVQQTIANPFEEGEQMQGVAQEPVAGGVPANQADADAINNLVRGIYQQTTLNGLVQYVPNNTCQAVLEKSDWDPNYNTQGVPDMPLDQIPQFQQAQPTVDSVENLSVAGDEASADVTVTSGGQADTSTMRFLREDGRWKFCSAAA